MTLSIEAFARAANELQSGQELLVEREKAFDFEKTAYKKIGERNVVVVNSPVIFCSKKRNQALDSFREAVKTQYSDTFGKAESDAALEVFDKKVKDLSHNKPLKLNQRNVEAILLALPKFGSWDGSKEWKVDQLESLFDKLNTHFSKPSQPAQGPADTGDSSAIAVPKEIKRRNSWGGASSPSELSKKDEPRRRTLSEGSLPADLIGDHSFSPSASEHAGVQVPATIVDNNHPALHDIRLALSKGELSNPSLLNSEFLNKMLDSIEDKIDTEEDKKFLTKLRDDVTKSWSKSELQFKRYTGSLEDQKQLKVNFDLATASLMTVARTITYEANKPEPASPNPDTTPDDKPKLPQQAAPEDSTDPVSIAPAPAVTIPDLPGLEEEPATIEEGEERVLPEASTPKPKDQEVKADPGAVLNPLKPESPVAGRADKVQDRRVDQVVPGARVVAEESYPEPVVGEAKIEAGVERKAPTNPADLLNAAKQVAGALSDLLKIANTRDQNVGTDDQPGLPQKAIPPKDQVLEVPDPSFVVDPELDGPLVDLVKVEEGIIINPPAGQPVPALQPSAKHPQVSDVKHPNPQQAQIEGGDVPASKKPIQWPKTVDEAPSDPADLLNAAKQIADALSDLLKVFNTREQNVGTDDLLVPGSDIIWPEDLPKEDDLSRLPPMARAVANTLKALLKAATPGFTDPAKLDQVAVNDPFIAALLDAQRPTDELLRIIDSPAWFNLPRPAATEPSPQLHPPLAEQVEPTADEGDDFDKALADALAGVDLDPDTEAYLDNPLAIATTAQLVHNATAVATAVNEMVALLQPQVLDQPEDRETPVSAARKVIEALQGLLNTWPLGAKAGGSATASTQPPGSEELGTLPATAHKVERTPVEEADLFAAGQTVTSVVPTMAQVDEQAKALQKAVAILNQPGNPLEEAAKALANALNDLISTITEGQAKPLPPGLAAPLSRLAAPLSELIATSTAILNLANKPQQGDQNQDMGARLTSAAADVAKAVSKLVDAANAAQIKRAAQPVVATAEVIGNYQAIDRVVETVEEPLTGPTLIENLDALSDRLGQVRRERFDEPQGVYGPRVSGHLSKLGLLGEGESLSSLVTDKGELALLEKAFADLPEEFPEERLEKVLSPGLVNIFIKARFEKIAKRPDPAQVLANKTLLAERKQERIHHQKLLDQATNIKNGLS